MTMRASCVFCEIVVGRVPSVRIFEDEATLAFLDIAPIIRGHTLVIPKAHYERWADSPLVLWQQVATTSRRVARAQLTGLRADGVNLFLADGHAAGQEVPHVHVHVIPRFSGDGHRWNWQARRYESEAEKTSLAKRIREALPDVP